MGCYSYINMWINIIALIVHKQKEENIYLFESHKNNPAGSRITT